MNEEIAVLVPFFPGTPGCLRRSLTVPGVGGERNEALGLLPVPAASSGAAPPGCLHKKLQPGSAVTLPCQQARAPVQICSPEPSHLPGLGRGW